eukprot:GFYU01002841.1.p1 GENE.GFYU01002841.1~~GFYU01002841.1.p1  ORF type:complete len:227 (-),score=78.60 GFYU01002841.1:413-1093(-)
MNPLFVQELETFSQALQNNLPSLKAAAAHAAHKDETPSDQTLCKEWGGHIQNVLFTEEVIAGRVAELAAQVSRDYAGRDKPPIFIGLLTGAFVFVADFLRKVSIPYEIEFMALSSYGKSTTSSGVVKLLKDIDVDPEGRDIVFLEDICDSGRTFTWLIDYLKSKKCNSVRFCCLLDKIARRTVDVKIDYIGFECPDAFVVGYGMDYAGSYRCLPFVGVLKPEVYEK